MIENEAIFDSEAEELDEVLVHTVLNPTYTAQEIAEMSADDFLSWLKSRNGYVLEDERRIVRARLNSLGMSIEFEKIELQG